jgi:tRNA A58 N-methylase Trm61
MFHSGDISKVRRILDATLTKGRRWAISVYTRGQLITYDRRHESVEYLSTAQYNFLERGVNNPAWYRNGKLAPRAYRGGCVVQYYRTSR